MEPIDGMSDAEIDAALVALGPMGAWVVGYIRQKERAYEVAHDQAMKNGAEAQRLRAELEHKEKYYAQFTLVPKVPAETVSEVQK